MCIIIANLKGMLSDDILNESNRANPDGAGLMTTLDNRLFIFKSMDGEKVIKMYKTIRTECPDVPIFIHFRISSSGLVNTSNCHPFRVNRDTALMHNGILYNYTKPDFHMNDTRLFIKTILSKIPSSLMFTTWMQTMIEKTIGNGNKFVMLKKTGEWCIFNEQLGHWDTEEENWFSNHSYESVMVRTKISKKSFYSSYYYEKTPIGTLNKVYTK